RLRLEQALTESDALRAEKEQLEQMRGKIGSAAADSFGPSFTDRVMAGIDAIDPAESEEEQFATSLISLFRPVAAVAAAAVIVLAVWNIKTTGSISLESAFALEQESVEVIWQTPFDELLRDPS
ncbi:MAG: hypothetical protein KAU36_03460, partial [candidate division Zixibacteria bacterium]|nr:hypothetical protein [candidate division Zixibacteria bacterium]